MLHRVRIPGERLLEPRGHGMLGAVSIARVELDLHPHTITHCRTGCFSKITMQIQIEASASYRHHVYAPRLCGLAIDAHQNRKRLAPARLDSVRAGRADEDERVDTSDLYDRGETGSRHGNLEPVPPAAA
jgi:hypothetical protein